MPDDTTKAMPFSDDAEKGILSCFLHNPSDLLPDAQSVMPEEMFYHPANRLLFAAMLEMHAAQKPIEYIALSQFLQDKGLMEKVGGQGALAELLDFVPTPTHYGYYKGIVRDKWLLRKLIANAQESIANAYEFQEEGAMKPLLDAETAAFSLLQAAEKTSDNRSGPRPGRIVVAEWLETLEMRYRTRGSIHGIKSDIHDFDRQFDGWDDSEGEVVVVAARPAVGKTAFMGTMIANICFAQGIPTAVFSIEMTANQLLNRIVLGPMGINTAKAVTGMFGADEFKHIGREAVRLFEKAPLFVDATSSLNTADLRLRCQTLKRQHNIRFVCIDYLRLVKAVGKQAQAEERLQITEVMETCRFIAKEFRCVVMILVQLNRETDRNAGKAPVLADLAGSASIEQDAHHIIMLDRPEINTPWHRLKDEARQKWVESIHDMRKAHPELWSDGRKYRDFLDDDEARNRQDYEEHAVAYIRKNRRGPTEDVWLRYRRELTLFAGRTAKLFSGRDDERQQKGKQ